MKRAAKWTLRIGTGIAAIWLGVAFIYAWKLNMDWRNKLIDLCAARGLEAVDLDYPHSPKCLNLESGIMTVPKDFYRARGGKL